MLTTWIVTLVVCAGLVLGAALWDEWREHRDWTRVGVGDDPAHADACRICAREGRS